MLRSADRLQVADSDDEEARADDPQAGRTEGGAAMSRRTTARLQALPLLFALLLSFALPRAFVVCVAADDHVSLEAFFEAEPCETDFIFGAGADVGWPTPTCTDIPSVQLSAKHDETSPAWARQALDSAAIAPPALAPAPSIALLARAVSTTGPPPPLERQGLRTTVLRL